MSSVAFVESMYTIWKPFVAIINGAYAADTLLAGLTMAILLSGLAVSLFLAAAVTDITWRCIPNRLVLALATVGLARLALELFESPWTALGGAAADAAVAAAVFAVGAYLFGRNWIGGGDVKLLAAGALWLGVGLIWPFLFVTALAGGALGLVYLGLAAAGPMRAVRPSLPYGVAIAIGGVAATGLAL